MLWYGAFELCPRFKRLWINALYQYGTNTTRARKAHFAHLCLHISAIV